MEDIDLLNIRSEKIADLKSAGIDLYPNDIKPKNTTQEITLKFGDMDNDSLAKQEETFSVAGRLMAVRNFGKAAFYQNSGLQGTDPGLHRQEQFKPGRIFCFQETRHRRHHLYLG
jgi:lysyl-tRNA synthetase class 2